MLESRNSKAPPMPEPVFFCPNQNIQDSQPIRWDYQPENDQIPPDPLLGSDTFIHVDNNVGQNGDAETMISPQPIRAVPSDWEVEMPADPSSAPGFASEETPVSQRKGKRQPEEMAERPSWLPDNWKMELRVRTSGATAGTIDRYYFDPVSGRKFRSKNEVIYYLETGSKRKRKLTDSDAMSPEGAGGQKSKKSKTKIGDFSGLNFDFHNPPQKLSWALTSSSQDKWMPFGAEGMVPETTKRQWDKAFSCISQLEQHSRPAN